MKENFPYRKLRKQVPSSVKGRLDKQTLWKSSLRQKGGKNQTDAKLYIWKQDKRIKTATR
jgi:hypothetical protein